MCRGGKPGLRGPGVLAQGGCLACWPWLGKGRVCLALACWRAGGKRASTRPPPLTPVFDQYLTIVCGQLRPSLGASVPHPPAACRDRDPPRHPASTVSVDFGDPIEISPDLAAQWKGGSKVRGVNGPGRAVQGRHHGERHVRVMSESCPSHVRVSGPCRCRSCMLHAAILAVMELAISAAGVGSLAVMERVILSSNSAGVRLSLSLLYSLSLSLSHSLSLSRRRRSRRRRPRSWSSS